MSVTQSLTSEAKHFVDHKCMCQICTCNNPNHKCPIGHQHVNNKTTFQHDYKGHDVKKPDLWGARDNLKFKKQKERGPTEYQKEYTKKEFEPGARETMEEFKKLTVDINMGSHLKNVIGNAKDIPAPNFNEKYYRPNPKTGRQVQYDPKTGLPLQGQDDADKSAYYQPKKWNHPKVKKDKLEMKEKTQYQNDYTKKDGERDYKNPGRLVHDNLITGGPDAPKNKGNTHYKNEFRPKSAHDYNADKEQFDINREFVRNAKPVNTNYPHKIKDTEYKR